MIEECSEGAPSLRSPRQPFPVAPLAPTAFLRRSARPDNDRASEPRDVQELLDNTAIPKHLSTSSGRRRQSTNSSDCAGPQARHRLSRAHDSPTRRPGRMRAATPRPACRCRGCAACARAVWRVARVGGSDTATRSSRRPRRLRNPHRRGLVRVLRRPVLRRRRRTGARSPRVPAGGSTIPLCGGLRTSAPASTDRRRTGAPLPHPALPGTPQDIPSRAGATEPVATAARRDRRREW